jgi:hypothetical protein
MGGHIGAYMFRDVFARFAVPLIFGTVTIDPFDFVELTPVQKQVVQSDEKQYQIFLDQFSDVADIQHGAEAIHARFRDMELVVRFIELARLHLHAAAAIVTGGYDHRGAVQSSLLATELALKSAAATQCLSEADIKERFGHNLAKLAAFASTALPTFDAERVQQVVARQPEYVPNRYSQTQPDRRQVGHTVMGTQYIVAEVVRQLSEENFRSGLNQPFPRRYP